MGSQTASRDRAEQGGSQTQPAAASTGLDDPLAVQQLRDPLVDPLQASAEVAVGGEGGPVQFTNPTETTDGAGNNTSTHEAPEVDQGVNAPEANVNEAQDTTMTVRVIHDSGNPLRMNGCPRPEDLYDVTSTEPTCSEGQEGTPVTSQMGNTASPNQTFFPDPDVIYIDDTPAPADVHQGGFADCYMLAVAAGAAAANPSHIHDNVVTGHGANCRVQLFKYQPAAGGNPATWVAAPAITTDTTQVHQVDPADGVSDYEVLGAKARVADAPSKMEWYAEVVGNTLYINCDEYYEMALWAPILEKGYAVYAEQHGQYGGFATASANGGASGYERISSGGGISMYMYNILYGPDADTGFEDTNYAPGSDLVANNLSTIENLLRLIGVGVPAGESFQMTASISRDAAVTRLAAITDHILGQDSSNRYPALRRSMTYLRTRITQWQNAAAGDKPAKLEKVAEVAGRIAQPDAWPLLHRENSPKDYRDFNELANIVMNISTDSGGTGQRMVYAWHFYSVLGANFVDNTGGALNLTLANLAAEHPKIDPNRSTVNLRNPHGTNEPNQDGTAGEGEAVDGEDEGEFTMTLDQFFRNFGQMQFAQVTNG